MRDVSAVRDIDAVSRKSYRPARIPSNQIFFNKLPVYCSCSMKERNGMI